MRILIIHTAFIGDIVLSTPLIQKIRDIYPESEIDYLTLPGNKSIISNNPNLRDILSFLLFLFLITQAVSDILNVPVTFSP